MSPARQVHKDARLREAVRQWKFLKPKIEHTADVTLLDADGKVAGTVTGIAILEWHPSAAGQEIQVRDLVQHHFTVVVSVPEEPKGARPEPRQRPQRETCT